MHKKSLVRIASSLAIVGTMVAADALMVTAANADTQIRFSWWGGQSRNEKTDKILQLFEKDNPGITVTREASDWQPHWDKLTIQASAGNQPCTIQMQTRWLATYAKPDILRPLDDLLKDGKLDVRGIAQPVLDSGRGDDGKLYMIPSGVFYFALMYNKSMMEDAGVAAPSPTWTWSDFAKFVMAAKPKLPDGVNATHNMGRETDAFVTWVQTQGYKVWDGRKLGFPEKVTTDWFKYWEDLRKGGFTDSPEEAVSDNGSLIEESNIANGRTFITNRPPNRLDFASEGSRGGASGPAAVDPAVPAGRGRHNRHGPRREWHRDRHAVHRSSQAGCVREVDQLLHRGRSGGSNLRVRQWRGCHRSPAAGAVERAENQPWPARADRALPEGCARCQAGELAGRWLRRADRGPRTGL